MMTVEPPLPLDREAIALFLTHPPLVQGDGMEGELLNPTKPLLRWLWEGGGEWGWRLVVGR